MPLPCSPRAGLITMEPCSFRNAAFSSGVPATACAGTFSPALSISRRVTALSSHRLIAMAVVSSLRLSRQTTERPPKLSVK